MNFTDKNVVITGGSTGIGFATAKAFIDAGANVLITGRSAENLQHAADRIASTKLKTLVSDTSFIRNFDTGKSRCRKRTKSRCSFSECRNSRFFTD